jgi:tetratricopeptide (TPR) repeat protein
MLNTIMSNEIPNGVGFFKSLRLRITALRNIFNASLAEAVRAEYLRLADEGSRDSGTAFIFLQRLVAEDGCDPELRSRFASLLVQKGRSSHAFQHFFQASCEFLEKDDAKRAFDEANKALQINSKPRGLLRSYVEIAERCGKLDTAQAYLQHRAEITQHQLPYELYLALVLEKKGQIRQAYKIYESLMRTGVPDPEVEQGLDRTGISAKEFQPKTEEIDTAIDTLFH